MVRKCAFLPGEVSGKRPKEMNFSPDNPRSDVRLNPEKSAEVIVPVLSRERPGRTERYGGEYRCVSQRKRKESRKL